MSVCALLTLSGTVFRKLGSNTAYPTSTAASNLTLFINSTYGLNPAYLVGSKRDPGSLDPWSHHLACLLSWYNTTDPTMLPFITRNLSHGGEISVWLDLKI